MQGSVTKHEFRGLTDLDVANRQEQGKTNYLPKTTSRSIWNIIKANVFTFFNFIVIGSFGILFTLGQWKDALFGLAAISNMIIGITQEYRAKRILDRLALINSPKATIIRDWHEHQLMVDDIVLDDIVYLQIGDQIPTDGILLRSHGLEVNESLLTGEIDPISKSIDDKVLSGSMVVAGSGYYKTTVVGEASFASRLSADAKRFSLVHSELRAGIDRVLKWISYAIIPIILIVITGQIRSVGGWKPLAERDVLVDAVVGAVASIEGMIPLGLVLITSIAYLASAIKLIQQKVLMQELAAVEGLARADIVCFDKTGTLTKGEINFDDIKTFNKPKKSYEQVLAWFARDGHSNATMRALQSRFSDSDDLNPDVVINFSSSRKWSGAAFHSGKAEGSWVLGAPEKLYDSIKDENDKITNYIHKLSDRGRRVLMLSYQREDFKHTKLHDEDIKASFKPVAIISLKETLRKDAKDTIEYLREQEVGIRILSGDNPRTVAAIAREIGVDFDGVGYDARKLPVAEEEMAEVLDNHVVFGRVNPDQKKAIVMALQSRGHVVAMVGDGVNDAMAVKQSDVGVAIGSGSDATRAVSRFILLDGDFSKFPSIVAQGRKVISNIERVSLLFLSKTVYMMLFSIIFGLFAWGFPLLPRHLSALDGLTIGIPAFFLAMMTSSQRYTPGFLERTLKRAIPNGIVVAFVIVLTRLYMNANSPYEAYIEPTAICIIIGLLGLWILATQSRPVTLQRLSVNISMYIGLIGVLFIPILSDFFSFNLPYGDLLIFTLIISIFGCALIEIVNRIVLKYFK